MALKILVAGIEKDERARIEAAVKHALGSRAASEAWTVSLVKVANQWSVTLNGPGERFRNVSFTAEERRLSEVIAQKLEGEGLASGAAAGPAAFSAQPSGRSGEVQEQHVCTHCQQAFVLTYEVQANGATALAPVACPHCWKVNRVEVDAWAAEGREYKAEKA